MRTLGIDPGFTNLGIGIFDGTTILMSRVDLTVEQLENEEYVRVELKESRYVETIRLFVVSNYALLTTVERFATEIQMDPHLIALELAILAYLKATFPHADVVRVSPITTRAFFNTSLSNETVLALKLSPDEAYALRKRLSIEVLQNIFGIEANDEIAVKFKTKIDDAAEAALLAVFLFYMTIRKHRADSIGHLAVRVVAPVKFTHPNEIPLLPEQRRLIVMDKPSKKRKTAAPSAPAPKKQKSRFFEKNVTIIE